MKQLHKNKLRQHGGSVAEIVAAMRPAASEDRMRYTIAGLHVESEEIATTDGRRLWVQRGDFSSINSNGAGIVYGFAGTKANPMLGSVLDGRFPEYREIIPEKLADDGAGRWEIDIGRTVACLNSVVGMIDDETLKGVRVYLNPEPEVNGIGFEAHNFAVDGVARANVRADSTLLGGLNPRYFLEQLAWHAQNGATLISLQWEDPKRPLRTDGGNQCTGVIMPVNLS